MSYNQYGSSDSYYNPNQTHGQGGDGYQGSNQQNTYENQGGGYNQGYNEQNHHGNQGYGNQQSSYGNGSNENSHGSNENPYGYQHHPSGNQGEYSGGSHQNEHGGRRYSGDLSSAVDHAEQHHPEDKSFFSSALKFAKERMNKDDDPDELTEEDAKRAHDEIYGSKDSGKTHDSKSIGAGAAMDILKKFSDGGSDSNSNSKGSSSGGMDLNKILGLAMAQAGKLFDEKQSNGKAVCSFFMSYFFYIFLDLNQGIIIDAFTVRG